MSANDWPSNINHFSDVLFDSWVSEVNRSDVPFLSLSVSDFAFRTCCGRNSWKKDQAKNTNPPWMERTAGVEQSNRINLPHLQCSTRTLLVIFTSFNVTLISMILDVIIYLFSELQIGISQNIVWRRYGAEKWSLRSWRHCTNIR